MVNQRDICSLDKFQHASSIGNIHFELNSSKSPMEEERKESIRMDCFRSMNWGLEIPVNTKIASFVFIGMEVTRNRDSISLLGFASLD